MITPSAVRYAETFGVSLQEAQLRIDRQGAIGELEADLARAFPETWSGLWLEHDPYRVVISATDPAGMAEVVQRHGLDAFVEFRAADISQQELLKAQNRLRAWLPLTGARSGLDIPGNRIVVSALTQVNLSAALAAANVSSTRVDFRVVEAFPDLATTIHGGGRMFCTSGFSVKKTINGTVWKGVTTAGHCPNDVTWEATGAAMEFRSRRLGGFHDEQWHTLPGQPNAAVNKVYDGQASHSPPYFQTIVGYRFKSNMSIGAWYCKYAKVTGFDCGQLVDKHSDLCVSAQDILNFVNDAVLLTTQGDSGGPWFDNSLALGTIACGGEGTSYAVDIYTVFTGLNVTLITN